MERADRVTLTFDMFYGSVFAAVMLPPFPMSLNLKVRIYKVLSFVGENQVQDHLRNLNTDKSLGLDEMHPRVLRNQQVWVLGHSPLHLKSRGRQVKSPVTGEKGMLHPARIFRCSPAQYTMLCFTGSFFSTGLTNLSKVCKTSNSLGMF